MKYFILGILTFLVFNSQASHIVGGEMYYDCLGGNQYRITVKVYRDCFSDGAAYDDPLPITVFDGQNNQIGQFNIDFPGSTVLDVTFNNNPCVNVPDDICIEEAIYTKVVTLPSSTTGYTLAYQRCCRGPDITNLNVPEDQGLTLTAEIPPSSDALCNSSPRFNNYPPLVLCVGEELDFDHSASEPDGDQIIYELCTPYQGADEFNPAPIPAPAPPYDLINWAAGISATDPFGGGTINLDANTGHLTATPESAGLYVVGICAYEYRNGVLISTTRRDFIFKVVDCEIELEADIVAQENLSSFFSYCQGLTVFFENNSYGGDSYVWDFGVNGITTDVSTLYEPTYTYTSEGTYTVTLIVNPGFDCSDTVTSEFTVNNLVTAFFTPPDSQCIVNNSFDFIGTGTIPSGADFEWTFGNTGDATPENSTDQNPSNIVFNTSGEIPVTFQINYNGCEVPYTDNIFVYAEPTIDFNIDNQLRCAPYTAEFIDESFAHTTIYYIWDFGDGSDFSMEQNPTHLYENEGTYTTSLIIYTTAGCIDTLNTSETFTVYPSPTSAFTVDPEEADVFHPYFYFSDESIDSETHWYYFTDGDSTEERNIWHTYLESGYHYPYQVVTNEYGCPDTSYQTIYLTPFTTVYIPNAFTPDGSNLNEVWQPVIYDTDNYQLWIYTRWGEEIFYSNEESAYWDGITRSGEMAPDGIYVYRIIYYDVNEEDPIELTGHFSLFR